MNRNASRVPSNRECHGVEPTRSQLVCCWIGASQAPENTFQNNRYARGPDAPTVVQSSLHPREARGSPPGRRHWCTASIASAGTRNAPTPRVRPASAVATPATGHLPRRAPQNASTARSRKSDSLYGAKKKNAVGNRAVYSTTFRAAVSDSSEEVRKYSATSAPRKAAFD